MVSNEQVKTVKGGDFNPYTSSQNSKSYLCLQERTLEGRALSIPTLRVLFTDVLS
jgi:hypothetical protein